MNLAGADTGSKSERILLAEAEILLEPMRSIKPTAMPATGWPRSVDVLHSRLHYGVKEPTGDPSLPLAASADHIRVHLCANGGYPVSE